MRTASAIIVALLVVYALGCALREARGEAAHHSRNVPRYSAECRHGYGFNLSDAERTRRASRCFERV